jgi:hypothetical protein
MEKKLENDQIEDSSSFPCDNCEYVAKSNKKLNQHKRRNHQDNMLNVTIEDDCCSKNSEKIEKLEKFVLKLQNKIEDLETIQRPPRSYNTMGKDWTEDQSLEGLIRRLSNEINCEDCAYVATSITRFNHHMWKEHSLTCNHSPKPCNQNIKYIGKEKLNEHMELIHNQIPFTELEINNLTQNEEYNVFCGPDTPRKKQLQKLRSKT